MIVAGCAEQVYGILRYGYILLRPSLERTVYRGELLIEGIALIRAQLVFTHVNLDLPHLLLSWFVYIKRFFILLLIDVHRADDLIAKECYGVKVVAKTKCALSDRHHLVGYGDIFQFLAIVKCIFTNGGDGWWQRCKLTVGLAGREYHQRILAFR